MGLPGPQARVLVEAARGVVDAAVAALAERCRSSDLPGRLDSESIDRHQVVAANLSAAACLVEAGEQLLTRVHDEWTAQLSLAYAGHLVGEITRRAMQGHLDWGSLPWTTTGPVSAALAASQDPALCDAIADVLLTGRLPEFDLGSDLASARQVFRAFARDRVAPHAEAVHRGDLDVPEDLIEQFAQMGFFGMAIPERFGGSASATEGGYGLPDLLAMLVATEEISTESMALAGPFITRPEIMATAVLQGGDEEQARRWLPGVASGEAMVAVAVTEPDFGSDVASLGVRAERVGNYYRVRGVKTWSTFSGRADLLLLLARTGTPEDKHRGLSLFVIEKPAFPGHSWSYSGPHGGLMRATAIPTIGYRGMHSFEISFEDFMIPAENLVGGEQGAGRGFYLQMKAFANGRMQTAGRAVGLMTAALRDAAKYSSERTVFGNRLSHYQLTRSKLSRMACLIAASRAYEYRCAELIAEGGGQLAASMVKSFACVNAEWVTREAQQIHGGYGYAEEFAVSRYFLDARVLSLFEGADETLALRVIARGLLQRQLDSEEAS
jgi:(2S)-methylsuccinyl-CoA dehydrogenase